jgi:3-isopropylmalate/(R)-2-methylmalate dehydratase small subunit
MVGNACVVAKSFSRIFYRNAVNIGLPLLVLKSDIANPVEGGDGWVDVKAGRLSFDQGKTHLQGVVPPPIVLNILGHGGLMNYVAAKSTVTEPALE